MHPYPDLLAVDASTRATGWATYAGQELTACNLIRAKNVLDMIEAVRNRLPHGLPGVLELPQVYRQRQQKGDPNDLIGVAAVAGACAMICTPPIRLVLPREWKGTVPKHIDNARTLRTLTRAELRIVEACECPDHLMDNVLDAVGLGLWHLGRKR